MPHPGNTNPMNTPADTSRRSADTSPAASPLWAVLTLTALNSFSTGAISYGVFFITQEQYGFDERRNLLLGLLLGAFYVVGALCISPLLKSRILKHSVASTRLVFVLLLLGMSVSIAMPGVVHVERALWVTMPVYMILIGGSWPIIESYVSGGKQGASLRHAISAFNVTWAPSVLLAMWFVAPLLKINPLGSFLLVAAIHAACVPIVFALRREPGHHGRLASAPHPQIYDSLLPVFRWLLFSSYLLAAALSPLLPHRFDTLSVAVAWAMVLASSWMASRIAMFALLGIWHGWHGRWRTVYWTTILLLGGFALALLAHDPVVLVIGLLLFGFGMGGIYTAALYYAMAIGASEVDAGGKHEAAIGMGFALGPLAGLLGYRIAALETVWLTPNQAAMLVSILLVLIAIGHALRTVCKSRSS